MTATTPSQGSWQARRRRQSVIDIDDIGTGPEKHQHPGARATYAVVVHDYYGSTPTTTAQLGHRKHLPVGRARMTG